MAKWLQDRCASVASILFVGAIASGCAYFSRPHVDQQPSVHRRERSNALFTGRESGRSNDGGSRSRSGY